MLALYVEACDADERKKNAYEIKNLTVTCHLVAVCVHTVILSKCSLLERVGLNMTCQPLIMVPTQSIKSLVNNKSEIV